MKLPRQLFEGVDFILDGQHARTFPRSVPGKPRFFTGNGESILTARAKGVRLFLDFADRYGIDLGEYVEEARQEIGIRPLPAKLIGTAAGRIMEEPHLLLHEGQGSGEGRRSFRASGSDFAFLVTRGGRYTGLVTRDDVNNLARKGDFPLKEIALTDLPSCDPDTVMEDIFPLAAAGRFPIPVIDGSGRLLGVVYNSTIIRSLIHNKGELHDV